MSILLGVLDKNFAMICADTQLNCFDGTKKEIQKVYQINDSLIIGIGGDSKIMCDIISNIQDMNKSHIMNFAEANDIISSLFYEFSTQPSIPDIFIIFAGKINNIIVMRFILIRNHQPEDTGILYPKELQDRRLGDSYGKHYSDVKKYFNKNPMSSTEIIEAFQNVINDGIEFDDTINNKMQSVIIE